MNLIQFEKIYEKYTTDNADFEICNILLNKLKEKDPITYNHCYRVGCMASNFSMFLGYSDSFNKFIFNSSILHDIGKLKVSNDIMSKPGRSLTKNERKILVAHPLYGVEILEDNAYKKINYVIPIVALHHESPISGLGTFKVNKNDLADYIFIIKICDCFDAIRIARRPDEIDKNLEESLDMLNHKCFHNLTQPWIDKFNQYIKYIL